MPDPTSQLRLRIFDGSRQPFAIQNPPVQFLVRIIDGNQQQHVSEFFTQNDLTFILPFFDNLGDRYTALVSADGYMQAGYQPVNLTSAYLTTLDLMLVRNDPGFDFATASWPQAKAAYPFLVTDPTDAASEARYDGLLKNNEKALACILNLGEAMGQISLPQTTPLDYIKQIRWDAPYAPAQDRFFAWCNPALVDQVKAAAAAGLFAVELDPGLLHPGATASWKQIQFGEANVQLTFHQNDTLEIDGIQCVMLEPDIDYYRDPLAHIILEVIPNALTGSLTNPVEVYVLRWIAGQTAGIPEFAPLYTLT